MSIKSCQISPWQISLDNNCPKSHRNLGNLCQKNYRSFKCYPNDENSLNLIFAPLKFFFQKHFKYILAYLNIEWLNYGKFRFNEKLHDEKHFQVSLLLSGTQMAFSVTIVEDRVMPNHPISWHSVRHSVILTVQNLICRAPTVSSLHLCLYEHGKPQKVTLG